MDRERTDENKEIITKLFEEEFEGTKSLYSDIGYLMRMDLWNDIIVQEWLDLSVDCKQGVVRSEDKAKDFFDKIISTMNGRIQSMNPQFRSHMRFNRNCLQEKFANDPVQFVHAMADNFEKENHLLSRYRNQAEFQSSSLEEVPCQIDDQCFDESEKLLKNLVYKLQELEQCQAGNPNIFLPNVNIPISSHMLGLSQDLIKETFDCLENLMQSLQICDQKVRELIGNFLRSEAYKSVYLIPQISISYEELSFVCDRYISALGEAEKHLHQSNTMLLSSDPKYHAADQCLKQLINNYFERSMIFTRHPKEVILVTNNEKSVEKEMKVEATVPNPPTRGRRGQKTAQKDKVKTFSTKKKEYVEAKVSILGLNKVKNHTIRCHSLKLATEQQLAYFSQTGQSNAELCQISCGRIHPEPELPNCSEIEFKSMKIEEYERASDSVYEQMVRLCYIIEIQAFGQTFTLKFHGDFQVITVLPVRKVIDMLENRIKSTCPDRKRGLSQQGRVFLQERIPEIDSQKNVTLHTFIKDKMKVPLDNRNTEAVSYNKFTFFAWFYALVRTIERDFQAVWHDGIIYDLFTYRDTQEFMLQENITSGCVILRPGLSKIYTPNSPDAYIRFTADIKVRINGRWKVVSLPMDPECLKNSSLYSVVANMNPTKNMNSGKVRPNSIYTRKGILPLPELKNYNVNQGNSSVLDRYHGLIIKVSSCLTVHDSESEDEYAKEEVLDTGDRKRKAARKDSTSSFQDSMSATSSVVSIGASPFGGRTTDTDFCPNCDSPDSQTSTSERPNGCPTTDVKEENNISNNEPRKWKEFGGQGEKQVQVDITNIPSIHSGMNDNMLQYYPYDSMNQYPSEQPHVLTSGYPPVEEIEITNDNSTLENPLNHLIFPNSFDSGLIFDHHFIDDLAHPQTDSLASYSL